MINYNNTLKTGIRFRMGDYVYGGDLRYFDGILAITGIPIQKTPVRETLPGECNYNIEVQEKKLDERPGTCYFDVYGIYIISYDASAWDRIFEFNPWLRIELEERWCIK